MMRIIVVHSHLRWDFVWQRPQHEVSRLAERARVLYVEEPLFDPDRDRPAFAITHPVAGLSRVVPRLPESLRDNETAITQIVRARLARMVRRAPANARVIQWFYTPMAAPGLLDALGEQTVVYECMDELSAFRYAPASLPEREALLLARADIVFTGGPQLHAAKSRRHANVHCFGCGVDAAHFGRALDAATLTPSDLASLPRPVLGYMGVIDERLDYGLLARLADARDWSIAMVGPLAKVDPADLPRAPNLHWLGARTYEELPAYLRGFDVCLMPFALNDATAFINPTKTLEYLAAGRPTVSTPIADVVRQYASIVRIAATPEAFISRCAQATQEPSPDRIHRGLARAAARSWDTIVRRMEALVDACEPCHIRVPAG